ncbi:MAG: GNAT family N-acetyltransferase [Proteobacteria bacterium]|nr:GNAT family N-acetyltransferase [Pseudomonadota bacterium]
MDALRIEFEPFLDDGVRQFIEEGVDHHNIAATGLAGYFPANFVLRSERGEVMGGLLGFIWGGWLQVDSLWVSDAVRGQGFGQGLLSAAETYARERGCQGVFLDTYSFQARPFYERQGYEVFGTLPDCPPGHERHFLRKRLSD